MSLKGGRLTFKDGNTITKLQYIYLAYYKSKYMFMDRCKVIVMDGQD